MTNKKRLFLNPSQAVKAICTDFRQYDPQLMLFGEILRLISNDRIHLKRKRDPAKPGAWINSAGRLNMRWLNDRELVAYMCEALANAQLSLDMLAAICARTFQTRAYVKQSPKNNRAGIYIETHMENFSCRQCGQCCRTLDYHNEALPKDIKFWQANNHDDILRWVGIHKEASKTRYRIWVLPDTGQLAPQCPFLKKHADQNHWFCNIHDVKPTICRNYPVSRKHGLMTGCRGFYK